MALLAPLESQKDDMFWNTRKNNSVL